MSSGHRGGPFPSSGPESSVHFEHDPGDRLLQQEEGHHRDVQLRRDGQRVSHAIHQPSKNL